MNSARRHGRHALGVDALRLVQPLVEAAFSNQRVVVTHLRDTQVYVHCARDGASVFDLPRSRGEQDWEQWTPLTRWITRYAPQKA